MKQKTILLIFFALAILQGLGAEVNSDSLLNNEQTEEFIAQIGQTVTRDVNVSFSNNGGTFNPDLPALMSNGANTQSWVDNSNYFITISGDGSQMFSASLVETNGASNSCTVRVTYSPTEIGSHQATLIVSHVNSSLLRISSVNLIGVANENTEISWLEGDVDGDHQVSIKDVITLIDILLGCDFDGDIYNADIDGNGVVSVKDVAELIDMLLGVDIVRLYPTILVTTTDGTTMEYMVDENSKIRIQKPNLIIETDGMVLTYNLENMAQLRYGEREVSTRSITQDLNIPTVGTVFLHGLEENTSIEVTDSKGGKVTKECLDGTTCVSLGNQPSGEYVIKAERQTIKIVKL